MSYIEKRLAIFHTNADRVFEDKVNQLKEKETYLSGTRFLRLRVLNNLAELMKTQMQTEMQSSLTECQRESPQDYEALKKALDNAFEQYVRRFHADV